MVHDAGIGEAEWKAYEALLARGFRSASPRCARQRQPG
jgi:hypothetical protein